MQVDWGECGHVQLGATTRKASVFVAVLCYSRLMFIEFALSQARPSSIAAWCTPWSSSAAVPAPSSSTT